MRVGGVHKKAEKVNQPQSSTTLMVPPLGRAKKDIKLPFSHETRSVNGDTDLTVWPWVAFHLLLNMLPPLFLHSYPELLLPAKSGD